MEEKHKEVRGGSRLLYCAACASDFFFLSISGSFLFYCFVTFTLILFPSAETHNLQSLHTILSTGSPLKPQSYDYVYRCIKSNVLLGSISGDWLVLTHFWHFLKFDFHIMFKPEATFTELVFTTVMPALLRCIWLLRAEAEYVLQITKLRNDTDFIYDQCNLLGPLGNSCTK